MKDGHDYIAKMREVRGINFWGSHDLLEYIKETEGVDVQYYPDVHYTKTAQFWINGKISIDALEALSILATNDYGQNFRG